MKFDPKWSSKDFYSVLDVAKDATEDAIKKAYRQLARQFHPDTNQDDAEAAERFKEISEAYDVLGSPDKRKAYDNMRTFGFPGQGFGFNRGSVNVENLDFSNLPFDALFGDLMGNEAKFQRRTGFTAPERGRDAQGHLTITFDQAFKGDEVELVGAEHEIKIAIPAGVADGEKVKFEGKGSPNARGTNPGDLYITFTVEPHPYFKLDGPTLSLDLPVTFDELVLGATVEVPLYPSGTVKLKLPAGTPNGRKFKIAGKGATAPSGAVGDLIVTVKVEVPKSLPPEAQAAMEEYRAATEIHTPRAGLYAKE